MKSEKGTPRVSTSPVPDQPVVWGARFKEPLDEKIKGFLSSVGFDHRLAWADIAGSVAHATMLGEAGIITKEESSLLVDGLKKVWSSFDAGQATLSVEHEDIHMNIEALLKQEIGPVADLLHTGRSRNDQVALDLRLYMRERVVGTMSKVLALQGSLLSFASGPDGASPIIIQGHTHLQPAQPVLMAHAILAYVSKLDRDLVRLEHAYQGLNVSPLGAGALAGTSLPIDPSMTANILGFGATFSNSLDAVSDRDFVLEVLSGLSLVMVHLSGLCEEIVLWCSSGFGWVGLSDTVSTGSSMMPQKRNPDVLELVRGKTGRILGSLVSVTTMLKGLPLAYNKDMQEDKEAVFDAMDTVDGCLGALTTCIDGVQPRPENITVSPDSMATDLAEHLVMKGVPFREAHRIIGKLVLWCQEQGILLDQLDLSALQNFSGAFDQDGLDLLSPEGSVKAKVSPGGTGPSQVAKALVEAKGTLERKTQDLEAYLAPSIKARELLS